MIQVFRAAARPETPWKNGGGVTRPVASAPGKAREFGWRLSLADVASAGPFSVFPGISRLMGILEGRLHLEVQGMVPVELAPGGPAFAFPGDAPTHGAPLGGPVRDINLMFDPECFAATLDYAAAGVTRPASAAAHLVLALEPLKLNGVQLGAMDAALLPAGDAVSAQGALWIAALVTKN
ncbi:MAG: HutD family protein [Proteobacteria bacterium]|nr:HutD family protein [Pseudomonadota bacterium]MBU6424875.1 HutD family protein [Rhodospirillales bacterium]